ncbi:MAG: pilin, partial [Candidatus Falkowbacteria bacterium]
MIILFVVVILILVNFILADFVFAGSVDVGMEYGEAIGLEGGGTDIRIIMVRIIRYALGFLGIIAVSVIMYGGWLWMTSGGDPAKVDKAKSTLKNAVIGLVIILSSFAIVSFILRGMGYGGGLGGPGPGGGPPGDLGGTGALGNCTVETVYPEPNQEEVPRNTAIIITFREEVDPTTICDDAGGNNDGNCDIGEHVIPSHVKISEVVSGVVVSDVNVQTNDNRTFLFMPVEYLGSPSEYVWHSVYLSNDILKLSDGTGMFDDCRTDYFEWSFEVSNVIDLDPPYVLDGGVFPAPDDQADTIGTVVGAVQATGNIAVNNQPNYYQVAVVNNIQTTAGPTDINVNGTYICSENNTVNVSINPANNAVVSGVVGLVPGDDTTDDEISIGCGLTLTPVAGSFAVGNSWSFDVYSEVQADSLTVGSIVYTFVSGAPTGNQIESNANNNITAGNIAG